MLRSQRVGDNVHTETNLKTPDIYLDSTIYEIKSPITNNPKKVVRNVKRALEKSQDRRLRSQILF